MGQSIEEYFRSALELTPPEGLDAAYANALPEVRDLIYRPGLDPGDPPSIEWAFSLAAQSAWPLEPGYVPLMAVDEESFACVVGSPLAGPRHPLHGQVVRWHLTTKNLHRQRDRLDISASLYLQSVAEELRHRESGRDRMLDEIGPAFRANYLAKEKRPRDFVIRPVRLACQNVIVGLAAFGQDAAVDALSVFAWQTCEVPHVATHDANRALAALTLSDAFKNGGTMEIRFDQPGEISPADDKPPIRYKSGHPEGGVPASLKRYARTLGLELGVESPGSISPSEARELFLAVTPMPLELRSRVDDAVARGLASPERLCFTLMSSQLWEPIELDFLLAVSDRAKEILEGGSTWESRGDRQSEMQLARAARMLGMLYRRLDSKDVAAAGGETRVLEDNRVGVVWSVIDEYGAVVMTEIPSDTIPWQSDPECRIDEGACLVVVPRSMPTREDVDLVRSLQADGVHPVLVVPGDAFDAAAGAAGGVDCTAVTVLCCPERQGEMDLALESMLLTARMTRQ